MSDPNDQWPCLAIIIITIYNSILGPNGQPFRIITRRTVAVPVLRRPPAFYCPIHNHPMHCPSLARPRKHRLQIWKSNIIYRPCTYVCTRTWQVINKTTFMGKCWFCWTGREWNCSPPCPISLELFSVPSRVTRVYSVCGDLYLHRHPACPECCPSLSHFIHKIYNKA